MPPCVWVFLGVFLDRLGYPAVGVSFTEHGVDGGAEHLCISGTDFFFLLGLGIGGKVGNVKPFALQLLDCIDQLGNGCTNVGKLYNVCFRLLG